MKEKIILVAKMYTGEYIENNIGHEIINFFKPDNDDCYYGYIIYNGKVSNCDKIDTILLVSDIKDRKIEILAKIDNPEFISNINNNYDKQKEYIETNNIRYGNVLLNEIMSESGIDEYGIYITYKAKKIMEPKRKQYILLKDSIEKDGENQIKLQWNIGHNLGYISNISNAEDYNKILDCIDKIEWRKIKEKRITEDIINQYSSNKEEDTFMDIINKKYDETIFSNMLYYYFNNKSMIKDFAEEVFNINLSDDIKVYKEKATYSDSKIGRIDLFIEDNKNKKCIVIENKLKSAINGRYYSDDCDTKGIIEKSQLYKYMKWVEEVKESKNDKYAKYKDYKKYFYIFIPNYKEMDLINDIKENNLMPKDSNNKDVYKIITYKQIYDFFNKQTEQIYSDIYYDDFVNALSYHIYTAEKEMERKFVNAIKKGR